MKRKIFLFALGVAIVGLISLCYWNPYYVNAETKEKARLFDRFCSATRSAMREDGAAFANGTLPDREEALRRFYTSNAVYHGNQSVALCLNDQLPTTPSECFLAKDWSCLAEFARSIERSLRGRS